MHTRTISDIVALQLKALSARAKGGRVEGYQKIETSDHGMLVDPINSSPFVFVPPNEVVVFEYQPGSGTDHLRQRILAQQFFDNLESQKENQPSSASRPRP